eukprot:m.125765 g.125765  ORF g.125765 m.125765 type:complete len:133 (-) comp17338_c0_seq2:180-578(-)
MYGDSLARINIASAILLACFLPLVVSKPVQQYTRIWKGDCDKNCKQINSPVCGSNGLTYMNPCYALCNNIEKYELGECPEKIVTAVNNANNLANDTKASLLQEAAMKIYSGMNINDGAIPVLVGAKISESMS